MSLKNTYGFSASLLDAIRGVVSEAKCKCDCGKSPCETCGKDHHNMKEEIALDEKHTVGHEKSGSGGYRAKLMDKDGKTSYLGSTSYHDPKHAEGEAKAYIDNWKSARAVNAYRSKAKEAGHVKEEVEDLDELKTSTIKSYTKKAVSSSMTGQGGEKRVQGIGRAMDKLSARKKEEGERGRFIPKFGKASNEEIEVEDEVIAERALDKTYPFKANDLSSTMVTLRAMLRYLAATGVLKKLMKEDIELAGVFFGEEVRDEMHAFMEANKSAFMIMHKPEPKKSDPDSDEHEDAYKPASGKDQPHVMNQLAGAADAGGRHIDTAKGKRYVSGSTAKKLHGALMRAKPEERAKLSSNLYKNSHSAIEKDHADAVKRGVKPPAEKKGRGRPKKVQ